MTNDDVLDEFRAAGALREGHFVLSSGLHSPVFLQKNLVFMRPDRCERLGSFKFRRGFHLEPGQKVVMVEDIVTTGLSSRECIQSIKDAGGDVVAAACIVDRSGGKVDVGVPLISLCSLEVPAYPADALPPELAAIPIEDPGSRRLKG
jgi:orotate phosphoribosyltransferase